jgi:UTP-glucose-1-phosphate uridylyltransferase
MDQPTLLVLAAGMGSRYGGLKQIDPIGPSGETIIDYSVFDAMRAGFGKLVFVIRRDIERPFKETIGRRFEDKLPVEYVFQELHKIPSPLSVPPGRTKPWGTGHAVLVGAEAIHEPFAVINGDDFYGRTSFNVLGEHLKSGSADHSMVGFILENTLSEFGTVARGICKASPGEYLESVTELTKIQRDSSGIHYKAADSNSCRLSGNEIVSLNMWGFTPGIFEFLRDEFASFLKNAIADPQSEFFIPTAVSSLIDRRKGRVKVLRTPDSWFGVTYREDRAGVIARINELIGRGEYPGKLWA